MNDSRKKAYQLIILFGIVSLLGDIIYEGARSVNGQYLATLGVSAATVGLVAGVGEFLGYAVRLASGYYSDKTGTYWLFTIIGYALLISVPLISLTGAWQLAAVCMLGERFGKALRSPAKDVLLSHATSITGRGFGFGLHEAMDQIGAIAGPLFFTVIFTLNGDYRKGYAYLSIPFILLMVILLTARMRIPDPSAIEHANEPGNPHKNKLTGIFWLYTSFSAFSVLGFANFAVIAYHLKTTHSASDATIPLLYAIAMGVDAIAALLAGRLYDRTGLRTLIAIPVLTVPAVLLSFSLPFPFIVTGMVLWGIVMAIHETVMRAAIADLTPVKKRGTGYGIFNTTYGFFIFAGSALMGILYEYGIIYITIFTVAAELCSVAVLVAVLKSSHSEHLRQSTAS